MYHPWNTRGLPMTQHICKISNYLCNPAKRWIFNEFYLKVFFYKDFLSFKKFHLGMIIYNSQLIYSNQQFKVSFIIANNMVNLQPPSIFLLRLYNNSKQPSLWETFINRKIWCSNYATFLGWKSSDNCTYRHI